MELSGTYTNGLKHRAKHNYLILFCVTKKILSYRVFGIAWFGYTLGIQYDVNPIKISWYPVPHLIATTPQWNTSLHRLSDYLQKNPKTCKTSSSAANTWGKVWLTCYTSLDHLSVTQLESQGEQKYGVSMVMFVQIAINNTNSFTSIKATKDLGEFIFIFCLAMKNY